MLPMLVGRVSAELYRNRLDFKPVNYLIDF